MRVNPRILLNSIVLISSIFGTLGLTIGVLAGGHIVQALSAVLLFLLGFFASKFHNRL